MKHSQVNIMEEKGQMGQVIVYKLPFFKNFSIVLIIQGLMNMEYKPGKHNSDVTSKSLDYLKATETPVFQVTKGQTGYKQTNSEEGLNILT